VALNLNGCSSATSAVAEEWFPHDYVPYSQGRDFDTDPWTPDQPRLTASRRSPSRSTCSPRTTCRATTARSTRCSARRRRVDQLGAPLDRRGGPPLDRPARLPRRHPQRSTRSSSSGAGCRSGDDRLRPRRPRRAPRHGLRRVPGARDRAQPPQHRPYSQDPVADRIMARIAKDENLHMVFYRDLLDAAFEVDPVGDRGGHRRRGDRLRDARRGDARLHRKAARSPTPASTTCASTTTTSCGRCCGTGGCSRSRARRRGRAAPRRARRLRLRDGPHRGARRTSASGSRCCARGLGTSSSSRRTSASTRRPWPATCSRVETELTGSAPPPRGGASGSSGTSRMAR
jgi:hypothetical protein